MLPLTIHYKAFKNSWSFETTRRDSFCASAREQKVMEGVAEFWVSVIQPMEAKWAISEIAGRCFLETRSTCRSSSCCQSIMHYLLHPFSILTQRAKCGYCPKKPQQTTKTKWELQGRFVCALPLSRLFCPLTPSSVPSWKWAAVQ